MSAHPVAESESPGNDAVGGTVMWDTVEMEAQDVEHGVIEGSRLCNAFTPGAKFIIPGL